MFPNNQQPYSPSPPPNGGNNPFDFITNSPQKPKTNIFNNGSKKTRILLFVGMLVILIILFIVVVGILNSSGKAKANQLIEVSKSQTEIIRLAALGEKDAQSLETRSYASTIKLSMMTSQTTTNKIITSNGVKAKSLNKELTKSRNAKSDQLLEEAQKNSRYDSTFTELINAEIQSYKQKLNNSASSLNDKEKATLQNNFNQILILQRTDG